MEVSMMMMMKEETSQGSEIRILFPSNQNDADEVQKKPFEEHLCYDEVQKLNPSEKSVDNQRTLKETSEENETEMILIKDNHSPSLPEVETSESGENLPLFMSANEEGYGGKTTIEENIQQDARGRKMVLMYSRRKSTTRSTPQNSDATPGVVGVQKQVHHDKELTKDDCDDSDHCSTTVKRNNQSSETYGDCEGSTNNAAKRGDQIKQNEKVVQQIILPICAGDMKESKAIHHIQDQQQQVPRDINSPGLNGRKRSRVEVREEIRKKFTLRLFGIDIPCEEQHVVGEIEAGGSHQMQKPRLRLFGFNL